MIKKRVRYLKEWRSKPTQTGEKQQQKKKHERTKCEGDSTQTNTYHVYKAIKLTGKAITSSNVTSRVRTPYIITTWCDFFSLRSSKKSIIFWCIQKRSRSMVEDLKFIFESAPLAAASHTNVFNACDNKSIKSKLKCVRLRRSNNNRFIASYQACCIKWQKNTLKSYKISGKNVNKKGMNEWEKEWKEIVNYICATKYVRIYVCLSVKE